MTTAVLKKLCGQIPWCERAVLEPILELSLEIAREGREGPRIGTLFTLGRAEAVLAASRSLILDPLAGHAPARTNITDPDLRGTLKELAQLDGAFVISEEGTVLAACRSGSDREGDYHQQLPSRCRRSAGNVYGAKIGLRALKKNAWRQPHGW